MSTELQQNEKFENNQTAAEKFFPGKSCLRAEQNYTHIIVKPIHSDTLRI